MIDDDIVENTITVNFGTRKTESFLAACDENFDLESQGDHGMWKFLTVEYPNMKGIKDIPINLMFENIVYIDPNKVDFLVVYAGYENIQNEENDIFVTNVSQVDFSVVNASKKYEEVTRVRFEYDNDGKREFSNGVPFARRITFLKKTK